MARLLNLFTLISLLANSTAHALVPGMLGGGKKSAPVSYLASKQQFSACEINFVQLLNGALPAEVVGGKRTNLWSESFSARNYLDELTSNQEFAQGGVRAQFLEDLAKFVHKDEIYLRNVSDLTTLMKNEGLISMEDIRKAFTSRNFTHATFNYSHTQKRLLASLDIDPAKSSAIEKAIAQSKLGNGFGKEYRHILRNSSLSAQNIELAMESGMILRQTQEELEIFRRYVEFLEGYAGKRMGQTQIRSAMRNIQNIYQDFDPKWYNVDSWFRPHSKFLSSSPENMNREAAIKALVEDSNLPTHYRQEYQSALRKSRLTHEQIEFAAKNGVHLRADTKSLERFKEYLVYMDYLPEYRVQQALKNAEKIYQYADDARFFIPAGALPPHKQFIAQRKKILAYEKKRYKNIVRDFKMEEKEKLMRELDELIAARSRGEAIDESRLTRIQREVDEVSLSPALINRARHQAAGEAGIFRKLINGCNGGGSARLAAATKKFARFKLALSIGGTPYFYLTKNWDKKDSDPFFWERLGQEMAMGIFFTMVSNKIITNTNKGFWGRYLEGYLKFGALDMLSGGSYDLLFGQHGYARYFKQLYNGGELLPSEVEKELEKLKTSPTFEEDVAAMMDYLEEMSQKNNMKNLLDRFFNLSAYSSLDDDFKITQEDLESEEAREVMLELLAEQMYLQNMGDWPLFQTGNAGADRWAFYRAQNSFMDIKSMALNIAIFEIMCREPAGKIGSWGLALGLTVGNWMLSGKLSYGWRREAINQ